ncbi:hypothetical protein BDK51DRAFT_34247 [Blyttiomyces helicus]|uniref:Uncharacterized protein n=1 Tax=Blyttiomyces helicus TaxID=388810 RepID=A0A4V1IRZ2_9FUNG|nr:hypothetical protein BDK51DRAFT_34247 [Blyttiomyces helicus]|eukprot:RKO91747.1 hypothetical protein BDK51DRAFT_34247 [Blyttiomyces helicus]
MCVPSWFSGLLVVPEHLSGVWGGEFLIPVIIDAASETLVPPALASTGTPSSPAGTCAQAVGFPTVSHCFVHAHGLHGSRHNPSSHRSHCGLRETEWVLTRYRPLEPGPPRWAWLEVGIVLLAVKALEDDVQCVKGVFDEVGLLDFLLAEAEVWKDAAVVGVIGRDGNVVLEAGVGPLVASLRERDLCLMLKLILERVQEVEGISCLKDEGFCALFGGYGVIDVRRFNGALEFVGREMDTDVKDPSHVVAAVEPKLRELLLGVAADARESGDCGGHCSQVVKCGEVLSRSVTDNVL